MLKEKNKTLNINKVKNVSKRNSLFKQAMNLCLKNTHMQKQSEIVIYKKWKQAHSLRLFNIPAD